MNGYREEMLAEDPQLVRVDREASSVVVRGDCWPWYAYVDPQGYGRHGRNRMAHRVLSWGVSVGGQGTAALGAERVVGGGGNDPEDPAGSEDEQNNRRNNSIDVTPAQSDPLAVADGRQESQHRAELVGHEVVDDLVAAEGFEQSLEPVELVGGEVSGPVDVQPVEDVAEAVGLALVEGDHDGESVHATDLASVDASAQEQLSGRLDTSHRTDRRASAEQIVVSESGNAAASVSSQIADVRFDEDRLVGAGGFEPPEAEHPHQQTPHSEHLADALRERLDQAVPEREREGLNG